MTKKSLLFTENSRKKTEITRDRKITNRKPAAMKSKREKKITEKTTQEPTLSRKNGRKKNHPKSCSFW